MKERLGLFLLLFSLFSFSAFASGPMSIYINGNFFEGNFFVKGEKIYVEAEAFNLALSLPEKNVLSSLTQVPRGREIYLSLSEAARVLGLNFMVNWDTGIADLYASPYFSSFQHPAVTVLPQREEETPAAKPVPFIPGAPSYYFGSCPLPYYPFQPYYYGLCPPEYSPPYLYPGSFSPVVVLPVQLLPPGVTLSNGVLPEDSQGHVVFIPGRF